MAKQACESEPVILFFSVNFGCLKPEIGVGPLLSSYGVYHSKSQLSLNPLSYFYLRKKRTNFNVQKASTVYICTTENLAFVREKKNMCCKTRQNQKSLCNDNKKDINILCHNVYLYFHCKNLAKTQTSIMHHIDTTKVIYIRCTVYSN